MFKSRYKCDDCNLVFWDNEPTICPNNECPSHKMVSCRNCKHVDNYFTHGYCNLLEHPYNSIDLNELKICNDYEQEF